MVADVSAHVTRFAPSPTGPLHLGHAFSALTGWERARTTGGTFLLRIEDLDAGRCRPEWEAALTFDLHWLGLEWPEPVMRQSGRAAAYDAALSRLDDLALLYPCRCTRGAIRAALSAPHDDDAPVYPGTCRGRSRASAVSGETLRLDLGRALALAGAPRWKETGPVHPGPATIDPLTLARRFGDVALARNGGAAAYHLAVVVDDAAQGVTEVTRGADLLEATAIHVLLQRLLGLPSPLYHHHVLIRDAGGKRLAKRDDARALSKYRAEGATPADIRRLVGLLPQSAGTAPAPSRTTV